MKPELDSLRSIANSQAAADAVQFNGPTLKRLNDGGPQGLSTTDGPLERQRFESQIHDHGLDRGGLPDPYDDRVFVGSHA
ncbi:MAG: hypothetical protein KF884_00185 [Fimbriimonadaceae bacterium]|nr:hypothetical protein [Fimbriimonadaceae bacterium]QYK58513.1 MAG: hypothetical protein KF884_00185 [Fimbriimonadaceae bacterium]